MQQIDNFISGAFVPPRIEKRLDVFCPATGQVYAKLARSGEKDVDDAVRAAKGAAEAWSLTPPRARAQILREVARLLRARLEEFAAAESADQGKPISLARNLDIPRSAYNFEFFASAIEMQSAKSYTDDRHNLSYVLRKPLGAVGLITPWNLPLYLLTWKIAPALASGCTIVAKPAEWTPKTAAMLGPLLLEAGVPPGVCNLVFGLGPEAGEALVNHPEVKAISFTGSTQTGRRIARQYGHKKISLEMGGKNAALVFKDALSPETIATCVRAAFTNQGEICLCMSRILVEAEIYHEFLRAFLKEAAKIKVGDPALEGTEMGALVSSTHYKKVLGYVKAAAELGGEILLGGDAPSLPGRCKEGYFMNPTVIAGLDPKSAPMQEEIFGPVVCVLPFKSEAEAIALANDTPYGLCSSVFTSDLNRANRVCAALDVGMVWVNSWMVRDLRTPFGGVKASGMGREGGDYSLEFFSEMKNVSIGGLS